MKTRQKRMGAIIGAVIGIAFMLVGIMSHFNDSNAASFPSDFYVVLSKKYTSGTATQNGRTYQIIQEPPNSIISVGGKKQQIYCAQPGAEFLWYPASKKTKEEHKEYQMYYHYQKKRVIYYKGVRVETSIEPQSFENRTAYALFQAEQQSENKSSYVQAVIWHDENLHKVVTDQKDMWKNYVDMEQDYKEYLKYSKKGQEEEEEKNSDLYRNYNSFKNTMEKLGKGNEETGYTIWTKAAGFYNDGRTNGTDSSKNFSFQPTGIKVVADDVKKTYTIGPFKINFSRTTTGDLSDIYLQDEKGTRHNINLKPSDIKPNVNFYITVNQKDYETINKVKLVTKYSYTEYTAQYQRYESENVNKHWHGQHLLMYEVNKKTNNKSIETSLVEIPKTIDLAGKVFLDNPAGKGNEPNGYYDNNDSLLDGVEVTLFDNGKVLKTTTTKEGTYCFKQLPAKGNYTIRFQYNGVEYETTAHYVGDDTVRNYATEEGRASFNAQYTTITGEVPNKKEIYAYARNQDKTTKVYTRNTDKTQRDNINLGLIRRPQFDMSLQKDLVEIALTVNGVKEQYIYNKRAEESFQADLKGFDFPNYERQIRKTDIADGVGLDVELTYCIRIYNGSADAISGKVVKLYDYYDDDYLFTGSYVTNQATPVQWGQAQKIEGKKATGESICYYKIETTDNAIQKVIQNGETQSVYMKYKISPEKLRELVRAGNKRKENFAEIGGYQNYYSQDKKVAGQTLHKKGEIAGLIDIDSIPGNFNPVSSDVQQFMHIIYYTNHYSEETKRMISQKIFEDDADCAPGLVFKHSNEERKISGNVWEDVSSVNNKIRMGNGIKDENTKIEKVMVQLVSEKEAVVKQEKTDSNGNYTISGFLPGNYKLKFIYGTEEALMVNSNYTGQDYKSTVYKQEYYQNNPYWYQKEIDKRYNDAVDDLEKRKEVNQYSKELTNYKALLLEEKTNFAEIAPNTQMEAYTQNMKMEVEYVRTVTDVKEEELDPNGFLKYHIQNVDFGIVERPRSELTIQKNISHVKMYTTDGQTIFDSDKRTDIPNLAWMEDAFIQATVDQSLQYGLNIELTYKITIENTGERDYYDPLLDTNDRQFYYTGNTPSPTANQSATMPVMVLDYIANNLTFEELNNIGNWSIVNDKSSLKTNTKDTILQDLVDVSYNNVIIQAANNQLLKPLIPGEKSQITLSVKKEAIAPKQNDTLTYDNYVEIVRSKNDVGRRSYGKNKVSIPGNFDPKTLSNLEEPDSTKAEQVIILPPFGKKMETSIYMLAAGISILLLAVGVFFIKKKVLY